MSLIMMHHFRRKSQGDGGRKEEGGNEWLTKSLDVPSPVDVMILLRHE